jgi:chromosome segregation ATPase
MDYRDERKFTEASNVLDWAKDKILDMEADSDTKYNQIQELEDQVKELNDTIAERDETIKNLHLEISELQAELDQY